MAIIEGFGAPVYSELRSEIKKLKYQAKYAFKTSEIDSVDKKLELLRAAYSGGLNPKLDLNSCVNILTLLNKIDKVSKILQQNRLSLDANLKLTPVYSSTNSVEELIESNHVLQDFKNLIEDINLLQPFDPGCENFYISLFQGKFDDLKDKSPESYNDPTLSEFFCTRKIYNPVGFFQTALKEVIKLRESRPDVIQGFLEIFISVKKFRQRLAKGYIQLLKVTEDEWKNPSKESDVAVAVLRRIIFSYMDFADLMRLNQPNIDLTKCSNLKMENMTPEDQAVLKRFIARIDYENSIEITFRDKLKYLKVVRNILPPCDADPILINGAGPGGLMRGLLAAYFNLPFTIVEKRSKESSRENVIVLGHFKFDMELLHFFGVKDLAQSRNLLGIDYSTFKTVITIKDLEQCMREVLQELAPDAIQYQESIEDIAKSNGVVNVKLSAQKTTPSLIMDCSGANSQLRGQLGIKTETIGKTTQCLISFFNHSSDEIENKKYTEGVAIAIQAKKYTLEDLIHPGLLFRLNKLDYIGSSINQDEAHKLGLPLKFLEFSHLIKNGSVNPVFLPESKSKIEEWTRQRASTARTGVDLVMSSQSLYHSPQLSDYRSGQIIKLPVRKADSSYALIDGVPIAIGGDSYSTVDPSSGRGASKTMSSAREDILLMTRVGNGKFTATYMAVWGKTVEKYTNEGFAEAFRMRLLYQPGTEKPAYFLNLGFSLKILDRKAKNEIQKLHDKIGKESFTADEKVQLLILKKNIVESFEEYADFSDELKPVLQTYKNPDYRIPAEEKQLYKLNAGKGFFDKKNKETAILMGILHTIDEILVKMDQELNNSAL